MAFSTAQPSAWTVMRAAGLVIEAGEDAQQRRLSAAARPDDADELAGGDVQVDIVEREHAAGPLTYSLHTPAISIAAPRR